MAVGASDNHDVGPAVFDRVVFLAPVPGGFIGVGTGPHAATGPAAMGVGPVGQDVHEVVDALLDDPAGFFVEALAEMAFELSSVFAGVVPGKDFARVDTFVEPDLAVPDELDQVVVEVDEFDPVVGIVLDALFHPHAAAVGSPAAVGHDHPFDVEVFERIDFALRKGPYVFIVAGEKPPVDRFPVLGRDGPVRPGGVEDLPPPFHVLVVGEDLLGIREEQNVGAFLVHGNVEAGEAFLNQVYEAVTTSP